jgi:hypothetical protein
MHELQIASREMMNALEVLRRAQNRLGRCSNSQSVRLGKVICDLEELLENVRDPRILSMGGGMPQ